MEFKKIIQQYLFTKNLDEKKLKGALGSLFFSAIKNSREIHFKVPRRNLSATFKCHYHSDHDEQKELLPSRISLYGLEKEFPVDLVFIFIIDTVIAEIKNFPPSINELDQVREYTDAKASWLLYKLLYEDEQAIKKRLRYLTANYLFNEVFKKEIRLHSNLKAFGIKRLTKLFNHPDSRSLKSYLENLREKIGEDAWDMIKEDKECKWFYETAYSRQQNILGDNRAKRLIEKLYSLKKEALKQEYLKQTDPGRIPENEYLLDAESVIQGEKEQIRNTIDDHRSKEILQKFFSNNMVCIDESKVFENPSEILEFSRPQAKKTLSEHIQKQREVFFRTPSMWPAQNYPVSIGFFYSWLRLGSGALQNEIAVECFVDPGRISRWNQRKNQDEDVNNFFSEQAEFSSQKGIFPVIFQAYGQQMSENIMSEIGMTEGHRTYTWRKQDNTKYSTNIEPKKELLWTIYENLMLNADLMYKSLESEIHPNESRTDYKDHQYEFNGRKIIYDIEYISVGKKQVEDFFLHVADIVQLDQRREICQ